MGQLSALGTIPFALAMVGMGLGACTPNLVESQGVPATSQHAIAPGGQPATNSNDAANPAPVDGSNAAPGLSPNGLLPSANGNHAVGGSAGSLPAGGNNTVPGNANAPLVNGLQQSGSGWPGDLNLASTSRQYQALSLDGILAKKSGLATTLSKFPAVEAALRSVSSQTGVPSGLLAGVAYQESSFEVTATSQNPDINEQDVGLTQAPRTAFSGNTWQDPVVNLTYFAKAILGGYNKYNSWGAALRAWNSGDGEVNLQNLSAENNQTDPNYVIEILGHHCMGLD